MSVLILPKTINKDFVQKIKELSGQDVRLCFQCGTCTGSCPMSEYMEFSPRKVMHLAQLGMGDRLVNLNTYWACASCHTCSVRCPRGIDIARVMEALRQITLRKNINFIEPSKMSAETIKEAPQIAMVAGFRKMTS